MRHYGSNASGSNLSEAQLLLAANCCASVVYDPEGEINAPGLNFGPRLDYLSPSRDGTSKATGFWLLKDIGIENIFGPALVISVRGTASVVDAIVNLNGEKRPASSLIVSGFELHRRAITESRSQDAGVLDNNTNIPLHAHAGFLNGAEALLPEVSSRISRFVQQHRVKHVLFTGHSAGGAVASLLFAHFLCASDPECKHFFPPLQPISVIARDR